MKRYPSERVALIQGDATTHDISDGTVFVLFNPLDPDSLQQELSAPLDLIMRDHVIAHPDERKAVVAKLRLGDRPGRDIWRLTIVDLKSGAETAILEEPAKHEIDLRLLDWVK